jgi:hypothetical protein
MASSRTNVFYLTKGVTIRGCFSKPQREPMFCPIVFCISADDDELQGRVGKTPYFLSTLGGSCFMICASRSLTSTVEF